jgi:MFS-type transporter involved in bile tolerance (Atg22 family)
MSAPDSAATATDAATLAPSDPEHPPTTRKERVGWYMYDFANSAISSVAISGFLPLLVQDLALTAAGAPGVCPNYVGNTTLVQAVFPGSSATGMYAYNDPASDAILPSSGCTFGTVPYNGTWCPGAPPSSDQCLDAGGDPGHVYALSVSLGGRSWNPNAYASTMISISTGLQVRE